MTTSVLNREYTTLTEWCRRDCDQENESMLIEILNFFPAFEDDFPQQKPIA